MSTSLRTIEPRSGFSRPTSDFRKTDLPVPDGPSRTEISPGGRVSVTSLQMFWLPNDFDRCSTSTATPPTYPLHSGLVCRLPSPPHHGATAVCCVATFRASRDPPTPDYS